jgi:hypothetical protein
VTFGELRQALENLGFATTCQPSHVLFAHKRTNTLIPLRSYRVRERVGLTDLAVVRTMLDERGLMEPAAFEQALGAVPTGK